jgi:NAD-dependent deacetylase
MKLAKLERAGRLKAVITQNIDGLHQMAGSRNVLELHGSVHRNYCQKCRAFYDMEYIRLGENIAVCACGGIVKPDVVLYEEPLDNTVVDAAVKAIADADLMIVGGTSLAVYPAAGLLSYFQGDTLVLINKTPTPYDNLAQMVISASIGETLGSLSV